MRLQDLPPRYQMQIAAKLSNGGIRAPMSSLSSLFGKAVKKEAASPVARPSIDFESSHRNCSSRSVKRTVKHSMPPSEGIVASLTEPIYESCGFIRFAILVNPRKIPTSQQKGCDPRTGRFFRKKHILAWERCIERSLSSIRNSAEKALNPHDLVRGFSVSADFFYPFTSDIGKRKREDGMPMTKTPDLDNVFKMIGDCIVRAGLIPDDRYVSSLSLSKSYTSGEPRIEMSIIVNHGEQGIEK